MQGVIKVKENDLKNLEYKYRKELQEMAKTAVKQHDKKTQQNICSVCNKPIKPFSIMINSKTKMAKQCDCGLFIGNKKIQ